jgi:hypothetical protein
MSHKSSVSGMRGSVQAIRLIYQKQFLLVIVGINIILGFENEYSMGIHRQAMGGVMGFLTFEEV